MSLTQEYAKSLAVLPTTTASSCAGTLGNWLLRFY